MNINIGDFVEIDFDIYANEKLVQTTNTKLGKENKIPTILKGAQEIILGQNMILKAVEDNILDKNKTKDTLNLEAKDAYGIRNKEYIKTLPKTPFDEQKIKPIVGMAYDFNGAVGIIRSVVGGRILVDFNNPLAGKNIKFTYNIIKIIEDIETKIKVVFEKVIKLQNKFYKIKIDKKNINIKLTDLLKEQKPFIETHLNSSILELDEYSLNIEFEKFDVKS